MAPHSKKLFITGGNGFTGKYLSAHFRLSDYIVRISQANLLEVGELALEIDDFQPHFVIHLAAISFAAFDDASEYYQVNLVGSVNLLSALANKAKNLVKVILASSAAVYGDQDQFILHEGLVPNPAGHYGNSKLAMEHAARISSKKIPTLALRLFNYTGTGHSENFLIPKIVAAYRNKERTLTLGNLHISREFNDVRDIVNIYDRLLNGATEATVLNVCSGRLVALFDIIRIMNELAGYEMEILSDNKLIRANDPLCLSGDPARLKSLTDYDFKYSIRETLAWMYKV